MKQFLGAMLRAIRNLSAAGFIARTGSGTAAARTLTAGTNISITNGDGVSGNPTISVSGDQSAYAVVAPATTARNTVQPSAADAIPLTLKGHATQSVDLLSVQSSAGSGNYLRVGSTGLVGIGTAPVTGQQMTVASQVVVTSGGLSTKLQGNEFRFSRAGSASYLTQEGLGGYMVLRCSNATAGDAQCLHLYADQSAKFIGNIDAPALPTSDPGVTDRLWNSSGSVRVSGYTAISEGGYGAESPLILTSNSATELPLEIEAAAGQTENLFEVNSSTGSGGDLFRVEDDGRAAGTGFTFAYGNYQFETSTWVGAGILLRYSSQQRFGVGSAGIRLHNSFALYWTSDSALNTPNVGFAYASAGKLKCQVSGGSDATFEVAKLILSNLPTSDPAAAGQVWNDSGTLKISAG